MKHSYGQGSVTRNNQRKMWFYRWVEDGQRRYMPVGSFREYPTKKLAWEAALQKRPTPLSGRTVLEVVTQYRDRRMPERFSTRRSYNVWLNNYILPKWGDYPISALKTIDIEDWLEKLTLAPKSRSNIKGILVCLFKYAIKAELVPRGHNPIRDVELKGASKRQSAKRDLTLPEFSLLLSYLGEPYRLMSLIASCLGLRFSELSELRWSDVDWLGKRILVQRARVLNHVDECKTACSAKPVPIDDGLLEKLKARRAEMQEVEEYCQKHDLPYPGLIFASHAAAYQQPYSYTHTIEVLEEASLRAGIKTVRWHDLRHFFRSLLQFTGAEMAVQQKLMRHADIRTTMNTYGDTMPEELREAQSRVARLVLPA